MVGSGLGLGFDSALGSSSGLGFGSSDFTAGTGSVVAPAFALCSASASGSAPALPFASGSASSKAGRAWCQGASELRGAGRVFGACGDGVSAACDAEPSLARRARRGAAVPAAPCCWSAAGEAA
jgi:hypothetical protein